METEWKSSTRHKKVIILIILFLITSLGIVIILYNKNKSYEIISDDNNGNFAFYYEDDNGDYQISTKSKWNDGEYVLNIASSTCDGEQNPKFLSWNYSSKSVILTRNKATKCNLYFDKSLLTKLRENDENKAISSELIGGLYRYQGTNDKVNNYLCLGSDCSEYSDDLYRIIGITSEGNIKIIKKTAYKDLLQWNTVNEDKKWSQSTLFNFLHGEYFNGLNDQIKNNVIEYNWKDGIFAYLPTGNEMYNNEQNIASTIPSKIGLMYPSDYAFASEYENQVCLWDADSSKYANCLESWIHLKNNQSSVYTEWTLGYLGNKGNYRTTTIITSGYIDAGTGTKVEGKFAVRPVYFLKNDIKLTGNGTIETPYLIV